jgi:DNA-binding NtrC family response regulator
VSLNQTTALASLNTVLLHRRCQLVVLTGVDAGRAFDLERQQTRVGKAPPCEIVLTDPAVSREHFVIDRRGEEFVLSDTASTNGTFLDGTRVREAYLHAGAVIRIGETTLSFQSLDQPFTVQPSVQERFGDLLGTSVRMRQVFAALEKLADTDTTVLLVGETGTGKGHAARALHEASARRDQPFQILDCGAITRSLIESEIFGHEKGAFTGADSMRPGALEAAGRGTLFIDELDELPLDLQPKLLRVLEERRFVRVGSNRPLQFHARVIAATKCDLRAEVAANRFRADLYFRVAVAIVSIPALRERPQDIAALAARFLPDGQRSWDALAHDERFHLTSYAWPGNVRELRNALERISLGIPVGAALAPQRTPPPMSESVGEKNANTVTVDYTRPFKDAKDRLIDHFERRYLSLLMARHRGRVAPAAREAELDRKYLASLLRKHGLVAEAAVDETTEDSAMVVDTTSGNRDA